MAVNPNKASTSATALIPDWETLFKPMAESQITDPLSVLVIGQQGSWKTSALASIPADKKVLFLDGDQRAQVLDGKLHGKPWTKVDVPYDPENSAEVFNRYRAVTMRLNVLPDAERYDVIVLDTTTPLMKVLWDMARKDVPQTDDSLRWSPEYKDNPKWYGYVQQKAESILFSLKAHCDLFVCLCHDKEPFWGEKDNEKKRYAPDVTGGLKNLLPKLFQEVYYTYRSPLQTKGEWWWLTQPFDQRDARSCHTLSMFVPQRYDLVLNRQWDELAALGKDIQAQAKPTGKPKEDKE